MAAKLTMEIPSIRFFFFFYSIRLAFTILSCVTPRVRKKVTLTSHKSTTKIKKTRIKKRRENNSNPRVQEVSSTPPQVQESGKFELPSHMTLSPKFLTESRETYFCPGFYEHTQTALCVCSSACAHTDANVCARAPTAESHCTEELDQ